MVVAVFLQELVVQQVEVHQTVHRSVVLAAVQEMREQVQQERSIRKVAVAAVGVRQAVLHHLVLEQKVVVQVAQLFLVRPSLSQTTAQFTDHRHELKTARHTRRVLPKRH